MSPSQVIESQFAESRVIDPHMEAAYNNRRKVPGHPATMAEWKGKSAAIRAGHPNLDLGLSYGTGSRHVLDIFWPGADRAVPLAVFIHGGYWAALDKSWFSHLAAGFLANNIALAIPSYDLCPNVNLATVVEDVRRAVAFLMARYGTDVYATGHSAGGHMTAMLLATDWSAYGIPHHVRGGCAISGLFDLVPLVATSINGPLKLDMAEAARLSPINLTSPDRRLHAYVGEFEGDEYTRQSAAIAKAWNGRWDVVAGADHFTAIAPLEDGRSEMMRTIVAGIAATRF